MIADTASVSLPDWSRKMAVEIYPGGSVASMKVQAARVVGRRVVTALGAISLLLSTGRTFTASPDHRVARWGKKGVYARVVDIVIGDEVLGVENGYPTRVRVVGIQKTDKVESRLVWLELEKRQAFVVEGLACRA